MSEKVSDIIDEILADHRELEEYYKNYKASKTIEEGHKWFNLFVWEISRHSVAEEIVVYNLIEAQGEKGKELVARSREEHRKLKSMLEDLRKEKDDIKFDEKFDAVFKELQEHLGLEEGEDLPYLKDHLSLEARQAAAKTFNFKKKIVPTRPHPEIPDKSTAIELALGLLVAPIDKIRDIFTEFPDQKSTVGI